LKEKAVNIHEVMPGSIAEEAGLEKGDGIISINGENIRDIFDYRFLVKNESLSLEVTKKNGEIWEIEVEKDEDEDLGIEFDTPMIEEAKSCRNKCIFCFIEQLPEGMRETLYFKDDDSRLSFLTGNYITMTNMASDDMERIIKYRMSPINISVHTTNPELRIFMLNNRFAGDVLDKIKKLVEGGITVNCQIVLCRDINDMEEMDRTISDLTCLYPGVKSISVVPVGITRHRKGLYHLIPYDSESSCAVISRIDEWQKCMLESYGSRIVFPADEFYIMAERELPGFNEYEDFPQIENGVGLISLFRHEFDGYLEELERREPNIVKRDVSIATGLSAYRYIKELTVKLEKKYDNIKIDVYAIKNDFFGENVTVTGLLTGEDIAEQLANKELGSELFISRSMLKSGEELFLDDFTVRMLEERLDVKVTVVDNNGRSFIEKVLGITNN